MHHGRSIDENPRLAAANRSWIHLAQFPRQLNLFRSPQPMGKFPLPMASMSEISGTVPGIPLTIVVSLS